MNGTIRPINTAVALLIRKDYKCAGTILHPRWVVTAGHCVYNHDAADILVVAGEGNLKPYFYGETSRWVEAGVKRVVTHPEFTALPDNVFDWDIALLELAAPLKLDDESNIGAARLPPYPVSYPGTEVRVGGWGKQSQHTGGSADHLAVDLNIQTDQECENIYKGLSVFWRDHMFCAGRSGLTTCKAQLFQI